MTPSGLLPKVTPFSAGVLQANAGVLGRERTETPLCSLLGRASQHILDQSWEPLGLAGLGPKWDSVCISQIKSAGRLYKHSYLFTEVKKLKSAVCVRSLNPRSFHEHIARALHRNLVPLFTLCLPHHPVKVCIIVLFRVCFSLFFCFKHGTLDILVGF